MTTILKWLNRSLVRRLLVSIVFLVSLVLLGRAYDLTKSDWSGWVQAIGSIGAIVGAVWVASKQNSDSRDRERAAAIEQNKARDESVMLVIDHCFSMVFGLPGERRHRHEDYEAYIQLLPTRSFENLHTLLAAAPLYEVRNKKVVAATMFMIDLMGSTIALLSFMGSFTAEERAEGWVSLRARLASLRESAWTIHQNMRAID